MLSAEKYAVAIDLGTTTIAAALIRLPGGEIVARSGALNPQRVHGLDVVSRLRYAAESTSNLCELQCLVNQELSRLVSALLVSAGVVASGVAAVAVAGNPTMSHLLLGLPVEPLTRPPFRPQVTTAHQLDSLTLGWAESFPLYLFPSPGGFVGGDTLAYLYGLGFPDSDAGMPAPALFLDLGTNGEIALLADGRLYATSAAAGPAFEGGSLSCGMAALPGAICSVGAVDGRLHSEAIEGALPCGLCGSGVLDAVALLLEHGLMDTTGYLLDPADVASPLGSRLQEIGGERHFVIQRDARGCVALSQADIRQIQLAKGAVRAGVEVLLATAGIIGDDLRLTILTGSFGAALSLESLKSIGVLTQNMVKNARFIREGALAGVIRSLLQPDSCQQLATLAASLRIIPLSGTPLFERYFVANIGFRA